MSAVPEQFWGASITNSPMEQARQMWLNAQAKMILSGELKMARSKKAKRNPRSDKGIKRGPWKVKMTVGQKIDKSAEEIVGDAIKRMAVEAGGVVYEKPSWSYGITKPGLHVRRSPQWNGNKQYSVVRAVGIDRGNGQCIQVLEGPEPTERELSKFEIEQSQFQRIEE